MKFPLGRVIKSFSLVLLLLGEVFGREIPAQPKGSNRFVNDFAEVLTPDQEIYLNKKLLDYADSTSTEIVIVTESSLEGDDLFEYSQRLAQGWGIGVKGKNNGVLIYVAVNDRKVRIHTGYGTEGAVTDAVSRRIIEQKFKPRFKDQQYALGLYEGVDVIIQALKGEFKADEKRKGQGFPLWVVLVIILIVIIIISGRGGNQGRTYDGRTFNHPAGWGGWGGWGGHSGGGGVGGSGWGGGSWGGGFGGGSFGGGGASGSW